MFNFPDAPAVNDEFVGGSVTYVFNGTGWTTKPSAQAYVAKTGDVMTGSLELPAANPTIATHASHKGYVDQLDTAQKSYIDAQNTAQNTSLDAAMKVYAAPFDALAYNGMQINGGCEVTQERAAGIPIPVTVGNTYRLCDGWSFSLNQISGAVNMTTGQFVGPIPAIGLQNAVFVTANNGNFTASTVGDAAYFRQVIEGYRVARLLWGTTNPLPLTYGMHLYSPVVGTIVVRLFNAAVNRFYYREHQVIVGWNWLTATIPGDTAGTWMKDNTVGLYVDIILGGKDTTPAIPGVWGGGTAKGQTTNSTNIIVSGNNIYLSGFIVLPGIYAPTAQQSPLIMRPFDQELLLCQRYYRKMFPVGMAVGNGTTQIYYWTFPLSPSMRTTPTVSISGTVQLSSHLTVFTVSGITNNNCFPDTWNVTAPVQATVPAGTVVSALSSTGFLIADTRL